MSNVEPDQMPLSAAYDQDLQNFGTHEVIHRSR